MLTKTGNENKICDLAKVGKNTLGSSGQHEPQ